MVSDKAPEINKEDVEILYESKYANLYKLHYGTEGKFYYDASRRKKDDLAVVKHGEDFKNMIPDAVSCFVILKGEGEPVLLLSREFRYVTGQFITGVPAGLIDEEDKGAESPVLLAAKRELFEETGITNEYLGIMSSLGNSYCGFVGNGEHYCDQFLNQSMSCAVFG